MRFSMLAMSLLAISLCFVACGGEKLVPTPAVAVEGGQIQGAFEENGKVAVFKGVPFAAPPVGKLRWQPPQPLEPWEGVRDAGAYGPICPQAGYDGEDGGFLDNMIEGQGMGWFRKTLFKTAVGLVSDGAEQNEDCLYLNVRTANLGGMDKHPVMVWIHGGGHQTGSGSEDFYQSNSLVLRDVVLVTINYRLGPLGYFAHPDLSAESENGISGNYGTLDQIAALRWVRNNIAVFGGDPSNVTIFGESAGGESVAHMMTSPLARGLFHHAIMQSAGTGETLVHLKRPVLGYVSAEEAGRNFAEKAVGSVDDPIKALRAMSSDDLFAALKEDSELGTYCYPIIDGYVLPKSVIATFRDGDQAPVPLLVGSNSDEGTLLFSLGENPMGGSDPSGPTTLDAYTRYVHEVFGDNAEEILKLYPAANDDDVEKATSAMYCDGRFGVKARFYAQQMALLDQPAYFYFFTRVPPSPKQTVGAFHAVDIGFVFERMIPLFPTNDHDQVLSKTMADCWAQFARAGDPNNGGLPQWPVYSEADRLNMVFGPKIGAAPVERATAYDIMEGHMLREVEETQRADK
jgi:para-nitrobenzyl esterase